MILGAMGVRELISWFQKDQDDYQFLLMIATGSKRDGALVKGLFDAQVEIDLKSMRHVLLFMSSPEMDELVEFSSDPHKLFLGAKELPSAELQVQSASRSQDINFRLVGSIRARDAISAAEKYDVPKKNEKIQNIENAAHRFTESLIEEFHVEAEDLPGVLVLMRGTSEPFFATTQGSTETKPIIDLVSALRQISEGYRTINDMEKASADAIRLARKLAASTGISTLGSEELARKHSGQLSRLGGLLIGHGLDEGTVYDVLGACSALKHEGAATYYLLSEKLAEAEHSEKVPDLFADRDIRHVLAHLDESKRNFWMSSDKAISDRLKEEVFASVDDVENRLSSHLEGLEAAQAAMEDMSKAYKKRQLTSLGSGLLEGLVKYIRKANEIKAELKEFKS